MRLAVCDIPHELESCACYKNLNDLNQMFMKTFSFGHVSPYVLIFVKKSELVGTSRGKSLNSVLWKETHIRLAMLARCCP